LDIDVNVRTYLDGGTPADGRTPNARYASFDYCFNYFQAFRDSGKTAALANPENIQQSCLQLGFYLASWGMFRGSSELRQRSARHLMPVVEAIANMDPGLWEIDAHEYTEANIERLLEQARILRRANGSMSDTLVTKVILGVFGSVPAFDTNVSRGLKRVLGVSGFGPEALRRIGDLYHQNSELLDNYRVPTLEFLSGEPTERLYTRAKLLDMAFFVEGMPDGPGQSAEVGGQVQRSTPAGVSRAVVPPPVPRVTAPGDQRSDVVDVVDAIKRRFEQTGPSARVPLLRGGHFTAEITAEGIRVDNLGPQPMLPWAVFQEAVALIVRSGGHASRGDAMNCRMGDDGLSADSVEGHIAAVVYGKRRGDTVFRRITPIACILIWAGMCRASPGELVLLG
jgi:hypothetical protein